MKLYIQTRSVFKDYRYLGSEVVDDSWLQKYDRYTSFEHPTIIAESDESGWRIFLGGLPSSRLDKVSTPIRYSFIIADDKAIKGSEKNHDAILNFISLCVQNISESNDQARSVVIQIVDDLYTNEEIEGFFNDTQNQLSTGKNSSLSVERLVNSIDKFSESSQSVHTHDISGYSIDKTEYSTLNINHSLSINNFIGLCSDIMAMEAKNNAALYLNFIEKKQDLNKVNLIEDDVYNFGFVILLDDDEISGAKNAIPKKKQRMLLQPLNTLPLPSQQNRTSLQNIPKSKQTQIWLILMIIMVVIGILLLS